MASDSVITLYDAASQGNKYLGWNSTGRKARYALDFKGVQYRTTWLEYPDIESTMKRIGASPTRTKPDGSPLYTIPAIVDPNHYGPDGKPTVVSDSWEIAEYLDEVYPEPGLLFPKGTKALQSVFNDHFMASIRVDFLLNMAALVFDILNEESRPYWRETREASLGTKLEDLCRKGSEKWDGLWINVEKKFTDLAVLLDKDGHNSKFIMGEQASFVDFVVAAQLETMVTLVPEEWDQRIQHWDGGRWKKLRDSCAVWRCDIH